MTIWSAHFLNARKTLNAVMPETRAAVRDAVQAASEYADIPSFDLIVRSGDGIPEWGVGGMAPAPGIIELTVNPARFDARLIGRTIVHELHHLIRWDGPGYGRSLGEALVSEGLAGQFVQQVLGGAPDPWDATVPTSGLAKRAITEWAWLDYDHALWFFGKGNIRKWAGYGLGHRLIAEHIARNPDETAVTLATVAAEQFRPAMRRLSGSEVEEVEAEVSPVADDAPADADQPVAETSDDDKAPDKDTDPDA